MNVGDIVIPFVNRWPERDLKGRATGLEDELVDKLTKVIKVEPMEVQVRSITTEDTGRYRSDQLRFHCTAEEWLERLADIALV